MSVFEITRPASRGSVTGMITRLAAIVADWNDARVTRKALSRLTDRELDDIGLCRGDIDQIAARD